MNIPLVPNYCEMFYERIKKPTLSYTQKISLTIIKKVILIDLQNNTFTQVFFSDMIEKVSMKTALLAFANKLRLVLTVEHVWVYRSSNNLWHLKHNDKTLRNTRLLTEMNSNFVVQRYFLGRY